MAGEGKGDDGDGGGGGPAKELAEAAFEPSPKKRNPCRHTYALATGDRSGKSKGGGKSKGKRERALDEGLHGTLASPEWNGKMAREYPFELDTFQQLSVACLERRENVFVAAHTSAGKTAVAEYAIAMAFRDNQKVVYTSPLKALSNQKFRELSEEFDKDVGLMTGDNSLQPNATCIVMTTEIMRSMIYKGSETIREVAWVIFDEVHYMKDKERGVVWEESIIFLPPQVKMVFLSATLSNADEFAGWVAGLRGEPCHIIYTDQRPVPLQHFGFPVGGDGMHMLCEKQGVFNSENFHELRQSFNRRDSKRLSDGGGRGGNSSNKKDGSDLFRLVKTIKEMGDLPIIVFSFSRRECEENALQMKLDFTTEEEKLAIEEVFDNALTCLNEDDRNLQAIESMKGLLKRGIGIHHSGLLPILKELIEILFQESLLKILFATETFAMGLNMPAKTVIFTAMTKWDGEAMRYMRSGEYIQMSGRAGRRGKDLKGICIMMIDDKMDEATCADMVSGRPLPLLSNYKLTYYTLLNLLRKPDGTTEQKKTIERSFHQYQHQSSVPELQKEIEVLTEEDGAIKINVSMENLSQKAKDLLELQNMRQAIINSLLESGDSCFSFLCAGRLVHIVDGTGDWGWGIIVSVFKKVEKDGKDEGHGGSTSDQYIIDVMLPCRRRNDAAGGGCIEPLPSGTSSNKEDTDILVVPVSCSCLAEISSLRVGLPKVLNDASGKRKVQTTILSVIKKYQNGNLPLLHPSRDLGLQDQDDLWFEINNLKLRTLKYRGSSSSIEKVQYSQVAGHKRKMDIKKRVKQLEEKIKDSQVTVFNREIKLRSAVLKRLGHIDESGVLTNKGRAACEVDTADELMASELMLEGAFNSLNIHQVVAVASCLVPVERSQAQVELQPALKQPLQVLRDTAKHIATVSEECKLEIDIEEYVESFKPTLMNVTYHWSKGTSFSDICDMTDVFEGSIIRAMRRLNELLGQMENAASAIGDEDLAKKFGEASASIQRGIIFAASLYI